jgi:hypothetical protein
MCASLIACSRFGWHFARAVNQLRAMIVLRRRVGRDFGTSDLQASPAQHTLAAHDVCMEMAKRQKLRCKPKADVVTQAEVKARGKGEPGLGFQAIKRYPVHLLVYISGSPTFSAAYGRDRMHREDRMSVRVAAGGTTDPPRIIGLREFTRSERVCPGMTDKSCVTLSGRQKSSTWATSVRLAWTGSDNAHTRCF